MRHCQLIVIVLVFALVSIVRADPPTPLKALAKMPVKEITVFKDGHAFMLHSGKMPTDDKGQVALDHLPMPVIGTFWPYSADKNVKLTGVTASQRKVLIERTAIYQRDFIEANIGAAVVITEMPADGARETPALTYEATIAGVPAQSGEELEATSPPNSGEKLPVKGNVVLMKTAAGTRVVNFDRILNITFKGDHKPVVSQQEFRNLLTLKLAWPDNNPAMEAEVGLIYLQKGVRWIPSYKVTLNGDDTATVSLQGTILNELTDMEDVTAHLVVGVPSFMFKDTIDPMALQQTVAQLSRYFQPDAATGQQFSNAIMTQSARMGERRDPGEAVAPADLGPELAGTNKSEDLFMFSVKHISLKKGQRMVVPIAETIVPVKSVYTLDVPVAPPVDVRTNMDPGRAGELHRLLHSPKVIHKARLTNKGEHPFTTAPAMIVKGDRILGQGMMTYTAVGGETDLEITTAVDVQVKKAEKESKRTPNAVTLRGETYDRVDLEGKLTLVNFGKQAIEVKVVRHVLGAADSAGAGGKTEAVNLVEDWSTATGALPQWWGSYSWPGWWSRLNGIGRVTWDVKLEPGKSAELDYTWHYFWR